MRVTDLVKKKQRGQKIAMLTAYDATFAGLLDRAGIDVLLVGDSLGMVILGHETTVPVTLDMIVHHTRAVVRGAERALVVADLPFLTYQVSTGEAMRNAARLLQEGGASAVKLEGGVAGAETVRRIVEAGIPVMAHIGVTPQSVHQTGGYRAVGGTDQEAARLLEDAQALEFAGAFAIVLECMTSTAAAAITARLRIPTIGIGAGPHCDGQVLVSYDAFGLYDAIGARFVKRYAALAEEITGAAQRYIAEVERGEFPGPEHSFEAPRQAGKASS
jgi:3-methyl-2-oxobutanoate hydroxymethyltransferase